MLFRFLFLTCNLFFSLGYSKIPDDISIPSQDIIPMGYLPKTSLKTPFYDFILSPFSTFKEKQCLQLFRKYSVDTCIRSFNRKEYVHSFFYLDPKTQTIQGKIWNRNSQLTLSSPYISKDVYFFPEEDSPVNLENALTLSLKEENAFRFDIFKKVSLFLLRSGFLYSSVFQMNEFKRRIDLYGISENLHEKIPDFKKESVEHYEKKHSLLVNADSFFNFNFVGEKKQPYYPMAYKKYLFKALHSELISKGIIDSSLTEIEMMRMIDTQGIYSYFFGKFESPDPQKISSAILASFIFGFVVNLLNSMVLTVDLISDEDEDEESVMHTYLHNTVIALSLLQLGFVGSEFALRGKDPEFLPTYFKEFIKGHGFHVTGKDSLSPFHQLLFLVFRCPMDEIILVMLNIMSSYLFH